MTIPPSGWPACYYVMYAWEGEYDNDCLLHEGHPEGIHFDGVSWFNNQREFIDHVYPDDVFAYIRSVYGPPKGLLVV